MTNSHNRQRLGSRTSKTARGPFWTARRLSTFAAPHADAVNLSIPRITSNRVTLAPKQPMSAVHLPLSAVHVPASSPLNALVLAWMTFSGTTGRREGTCSARMCASRSNWTAYDMRGMPERGGVNVLLTPPRITYVLASRRATHYGSTVITSDGWYLMRLLSSTFPFQVHEVSLEGRSNRSN